jgi:Apea-like HEPN
VQDSPITDGTVEQLYLSFAHAALHRWKEWAEKEGVKRRQSVRVYFSEAGITEDVTDALDFGYLIAMHREELSELHETDKCVKSLLHAGAIRPPSLSDAAGNRIVTPTYEQIRPWLAQQIGHAVGEAVMIAGDLAPSDDQLLAVFADYRDAWIATTDQWDVRVPLRHFETNLASLKIGSFELKPFRPEDKNAVMGYYQAAAEPSLLAIHEARFMLSTLHSYLPADTDEQIRIRAEAERIITAMRLLKPGDVGALCIHKSKVKSKPWGHATYGPLAGFTVGRFGQVYHLEERDVPAVLTLLSLLSQLAENKQLRSLDVALRRFNQGFGRQVPEDRVVDYVVALESCLLPDRGEELALRFALRGAVLLARRRDPLETRGLLDGMYDARSQIVHSGKLLGAMRIKALDRLKITAAELPKLCELILRDALLELLPRVASGASLAQVAGQLEHELLSGLLPEEPGP